MNITRIVTASFLATALVGPATLVSAETKSWVYGHINLGVASVNDGVGTNAELVDNGHSPSRIGYWVESRQKQSTLRFNFETALGLRSSTKVSQTNTPDAWDWKRTDIRKIDLSWEMDQWGTISVGQGSTAVDGVVQADLSGTSLVTYESVGDAAAGYQFRTSAGALSGITVGSASRSFDGARKGRIRYDTPVFGGGFQVSGSFGREILKAGVDDDYYDLALTYKRTLGDFKVDGRVGYGVVDQNGSDVNLRAGSFSMLHQPSGMNLTLATGSENGDRNNYYAKVGIIRNWFAPGTTAMSLDIFEAEEKVSVGDRSTTVGFGVVQKFDAQKVEAYFGMRKYDYGDTSATDYQDVYSYIIGARWKF